MVSLTSALQHAQIIHPLIPGFSFGQWEASPVNNLADRAPDAACGGVQGRGVGRPIVLVLILDSFISFCDISLPGIVHPHYIIFRVNRPNWEQYLRKLISMLHRADPMDHKMCIKKIMSEAPSF
jgi:hypothetical protein